MLIKQWWGMKLIALLWSCTIFIVSISAIDVLSEHDRYHCLEDECQICCQLEYAKTMLKHLKVVEGNRGLFTQPMTTDWIDFEEEFFDLMIDTLVGKRVRLDC